MNIFKTIKEGDSMLDLTKNIISNIEFYLEHMDFLANVGYTKEDLKIYKDKLYTIFKMYTEGTIPTWFENYNAYLLTSGDDFTYMRPYLYFCFSFGDMVDMVLSIGKEFKNKSGSLIRIVDVEIIDRQTIIYHFRKVKGRKDIVFNRHADKTIWKEDVLNRLNI